MKSVTSSNFAVAKIHGFIALWLSGSFVYSRDWLLWCSCSKFQVFVADEIFLYIRNSSAYTIIFPTERRHSMSEGRLLMRIEKSNSLGYPLKRTSSSVTNCLFMWYYYPVWSGFSVVCCSFFFYFVFIARHDLQAWLAIRILILSQTWY